MNHKLSLWTLTAVLSTLFFTSGCISNQATLIIEGSGHVLVTDEGNDQLEIDCSRYCEFSLDSTNELSLIAKPNSDSQFSHWIGGCQNSDPACTYSPSLNNAITAVFIKKITFELPSPDIRSQLEKSTFEQVQEIESGNIRCADLTSAYLYQVQAIDGGINNFNAMLSLNRSAIANATELDNSGNIGGVLRCAVIGIKDNIDVAAMVTTAGSLAMTANVADSDAVLVKRLRDAGAVLLGKTNLSEWAGFVSATKSTSGWSSVGGQTKNALNPDYFPCGSSSGSAVAVATNVVSAAIGTDTNGSIICPAATNGIIGFRPSQGLVDLTGVVPLAPSFDIAGPMTRTVRDAALIMDVIADEAPQTENSDASNFITQLDAYSLQGARIGYDPATLASFPDDEVTLFTLQLQKMENAGAVIVPIELFKTDSLSFLLLSQQLAVVMLSEFKSGVNSYLTSHANPGVPVDLAAIIAYNQIHERDVLPFYDQLFLLNAELTTGLSDPHYINTLAGLRQREAENGLLANMSANDLDFIVAPSNEPATEINYLAGYHSKNVAPLILMAHSVVAGVPHLSLPMGKVDGMPVGISLLGRPFSDAQVLSYGFALEQLNK